MSAPDLNKPTGVVNAVDNILNKLPIKENPLMASLGIYSEKDNLLQFYNRMGSGNNLKDRKLATVITKPYLFSTSWSFKPITSKVEKMLKASIKETSHDALKYFIQDIELPSFDTAHPFESDTTEFGMASNPGHIVKPSSNTFSISFLSTEFSLHEHVFYYWLQETVAHRWVYPDRPFTKAKLTITFLDSASVKPVFSYILTNVFPSSIDTLNPSTSTIDTLVRPVTFTFDNMYCVASENHSSGILENALDKYVFDGLKRKLTTGINQDLPELGFL